MENKTYISTEWIIDEKCIVKSLLRKKKKKILEKKPNNYAENISFLLA